MFVPCGHCSKLGTNGHLGDRGRGSDDNLDAEMPSQTQTIKMMTHVCQDDRISCESPEWGGGENNIAKRGQDEDMLSQDEQTGLGMISKTMQTSCEPPLSGKEGQEGTVLECKWSAGS